jgi:hypothetical protein
MEVHLMTDMMSGVENAENSKPATGLDGLDEQLVAQLLSSAKARGHFPNEQAALKCVYMAIMSLDPTGTGRKRWTMRWKPALNAFEIAFDGRLAAGRK